jgi:hypothetical protein
LEKGIGGRKIRENSGRGIFVFGDIFGSWEGKKIWRGRRRRAGNNNFGTGTVFLEDSHRGTIVAENFGLGGQETVRIPGAREPERLFLVGWEVTQFGQDPSASGSTSSTTSSTLGFASG